MPLSFLGHIKENGVSLMNILLPIVYLWLPRWLMLWVLLPWVWGAAVDINVTVFDVMADVYSLGRHGPREVVMMGSLVISIGLFKGDIFCEFPSKNETIY